MADTNSKPIYRIMDLHQADRPRERLASLGPQALTNAELIAILLRVGVKGESAVTVGQRLLNKFGGIGWSAPGATGGHKETARTWRRQSRTDQSCRRTGQAVDS